MSRAAVDIVVLNWNGMSDTLACLGSLERLTYPNIRIVVVDNGSSDDSVAALTAAYPDLTLIRSDRNLGYAGGNNLGIRHCLDHAPGDFVLLLNNDTLVDPSFVEPLLEAADRHPDVGIFGPTIYFADRADAVWFSGARWDRSAMDFRHETDVVPGSDDGVRSTEYVCGCALMVRRKVLQSIGLLDERFFLLYEEVDFCYRARHHGFESIVVGDAKIRHKVSASIGASHSPLPTYFHERNRLLFSERWLPSRARLALLVRVLVEAMLPTLLPPRERDEPLIRRVYWLLIEGELVRRSAYRAPIYRARLRGIVDYLRRRFGDCPAGMRATTPRSPRDAALHATPAAPGTHG